MPVYDVQGPDGRTYSVQGPAGASSAQLGAFIESQRTPPGRVAPSTSTHASAPDSYQRLTGHKLGDLRSALSFHSLAADTLGLVSGALDPVRGLLQHIPFAPLQREMAREVAVDERSLPAAARTAGMIASAFIPANRIIGAAEDATRTVQAATNAARFMGAPLAAALGRIWHGAPVDASGSLAARTARNFALGGATGALTATSDNPDEIGTNSVAGAVVGAPLAMLGGGVVEVPGLAQTIKRAIGGGRDEMDASLRGAVKQLQNNAILGSPSKANAIRDLAARARATAARNIGEEARHDAGLLPVNPDTIGEELQRAGVANQGALVKKRSAAGKKNYDAAFNAARALDKDRQFAETDPRYRRILKDIRSLQATTSDADPMHARARALNDLIGPRESVNDAGVMTVTPATNERLLHSYRAISDLADSGGNDGITPRTKEMIAAILREHIPDFDNAMNAYRADSAALNRMAGRAADAATKTRSAVDDTLRSTAASVPSTAFRSPEGFRDLVATTGDPKRAAQLAKNWFAFQARDMNAAQVRRFVEENEPLMKETGSLGAFEHYQQELARLEPYVRQRGALSERLRAQANALGDKAQQYRDLLPQIDAVTPEKLPAFATGKVDAMVRDKLITPREADAMRTQINDTAAEYAKIHDARKATARILSILSAQPFIAYMIHRYLFDRFNGMLR